MGINIDFKARGLDEALKEIKKIIKALEKAGSSIKGVALHARNRDDSSASNAQILEWLKEGGRDFVTNSSEDNEALAKVAAAEIERRLNTALSKKAVAAKAAETGREASQVATEISAAYLMAAMKKYMEQISDRIRSQKSNNGSLKPLSESYAEWKKKKVGNAEPIGVLTGQLLDNLDGSGLGGRNIKLIK
jgi:DNA-binding transcriptional MerR regulator